MNGLNSLSILENDIQGLAQKIYTGKELDRVSAYYNEHCEAVENDLKVLQILKEKKVDLDLLEQYLDDHLECNEDISKFEIEMACKDYNSVSIPERQLKLEEATELIEWLKEE